MSDDPNERSDGDGSDDAADAGRNDRPEEEKEGRSHIPPDGF